jgi:(2Fe-2S) ferredoxin
MKIVATPYALHLMFCTNTRADGSQSCGDTPDTQKLADELKVRFKNENLPVRVTRTACLGPCAQGPNIMAYPQQVWYQEVTVQDAEAIFQHVKSLLAPVKTDSLHGQS